MAVCVAVALGLALGLHPGTAGASGAPKERVRQMLVHICTSYSAARPSRGNLKQVSQFLQATELSLDQG